MIRKVVYFYHSLSDYTFLFPENKGIVFLLFIEHFLPFFVHSCVSGEKELQLKKYFFNSFYF